HTPALRLTRILDMYKRYGGREFFIDMPTYISEQNGGDRNWAITYLLREFEMIDGDITQTLDLYLQQCSILLDCRDLALMAATLANGGINPRTGEQAIKPQYVRDILSVMFMCGMYDSAGKWAYEVGFPAKSGVSGALMLVVPGELGIAIYSPTLDEHGNSVRGVKTGMDLFRALNVHIFDTQPLAP
ncbi:glutaminase A, partial [bacterium]|nr:glutaminase A [bacterium]